MLFFFIHRSGHITVFQLRVSHEHKRDCLSMGIDYLICFISILMNHHHLQIAGTKYSFWAQFKEAEHRELFMRV